MALDRFVVDGDACRVQLYNRSGRKVAEAVIDTADIEKCSRYTWCRSAQGYAVADSGRVLMHRLLVGEESYAGDTTDTDHINRNKLDNRRKNLLPCTRAVNMQNCRARKDSQTGIKGVQFHSTTGKWRARIKIKGKQTSLGLFDTPEAAGIAYETKRLDIRR